MLLNRIYQPHVFVHYELIDFEIGDRDVKRLSKALKINTTITKLHLKSEPNNTNGINQQLILIKSTGNFIGDTGATLLSDVLKSNTTLTDLDLGREHKIEQTNGIHQQSKFPFSLNEQTTELKKRVEYL